MRILLACESFVPAGALSGVTVALERLATYLLRQGHQVSIVTTSTEGNFKVERREDGLTVYRLSSYPNPFRPGLRFSLAPSRQLRQVWAEVQPKLVHLHDPAAICWETTHLARQQGVPVLATNHFLPAYVLTYLPWLKPFHPLVRAGLERRMARLYALCSAIIAPSQSVARLLEGLGLSVPIHVISNGVEVGRFATPADPAKFRAEYGIGLDCFLLGFVGRLDPEKNVGVLLEALAKTESCHLVVVGRGKQSEQLAQRGRQLGLEERLTWIPRLENQGNALPRLYQSLDAFCMPCPIETESIATLEAMAAGRPILAAQAGALPELIAERENGFLLPHDQPDAWANAIKRLQEDPSLCAAMGRLSRERVAERDLSVSLAKVGALYKETLPS